MTIFHVSAKGNSMGQPIEDPLTVTQISSSPIVSSDTLYPSALDPSAHNPSCLRFNGTRMLHIYCTCFSNFWHCYPYILQHFLDSLTCKYNTLCMCARPT